MFDDVKKGEKLKLKQKLKLDKKQNPKLWEKGGEIKLKQILKKLNKYWRKTRIERLNKTLRNFGIEIWYQTEKFGIRQNFNPSKAKSWVQCK